MTDSPFDIASFLKAFLPAGTQKIAVAVSGGPDSMALCHALGGHGLQVHALTVDHGLRSGSAAEAKQITDWLDTFENTEHHILTRTLDEKPERKIQEDARTDRYKMMADYCAARVVEVLFVAHHQDDQAETFLFRLAKGSGLDGLGAMRPVHQYDDRLRILRPLLNVSKEELIDYCNEHELPFVKDPSNEDERYARVRLRKSAEVLEEEGLSAKRLGVTAARLARARDALDHYTAQAFEKAMTEKSPHRIVLDFSVVKALPAEIRLRLIQDVIGALGHKKEYGPRMEKLEDLEERLFGEAAATAATLGGCQFSVKCAENRLIIETEGNEPI